MLDDRRGVILDGMQTSGGEEIPEDQFPHRSGAGCACHPIVRVDSTGALYLEHLDMEGPNHEQR